ncbi:hypothetical protein [Mycobacterium kyorinense]|uniref:Proline rich protein n=1 Tax=Mycobacterium kyorinense TaxID=487514 RepID=A0A1X1Y0W8_9MYCO|nr:hypothetical protein [Mycobacterium kyorinense]ORW04762.1 hypothetical protein AWC14_02645 [Mycobacterium kyorinense]
MKFFSLDRLKKIGQDAERGWPGYLFGGHVRTSTVVLVVAFVAVWWVYDSNKHTQSSTPTQVPATQVVPPGYVPDPNYTWVPRSRLQQPPTRTWTPTTTTTTTTTTPPTTTTTTTAPPPFQLPVLPPPFGPGTTTSTSTPPPPEPGPAPAPPPIP